MSTPGENALSAYLVAEREKFYRLAYSCLHHREDALDAVQTAVCRALERQEAPEEDGETNFSRTLGLPYARCEGGIAVYCDGAWQLFTLKE